MILRIDVFLTTLFEKIRGLCSLRQDDGRIERSASLQPDGYVTWHDGEGREVCRSTEPVPLNRWTRIEANDDGISVFDVPPPGQVNHG